MTAFQDPVVQRRLLRVALRRARDAAGLKQADVARAMDWSPSKLIRIERGDVSVSTSDLTALLYHYGVKDEIHVNGLLKLARSARGRSFYDQYGGVLKPGFREYLAHEASASVLRHYEPVFIPGLLQTEEYARAILEHVFGLGADDVDKTWTVRQHRQEIHDREQPPDMLFVLDEPALRRNVGRRHVLLHQLKQLKELAVQQHISLQILPFALGAHPGMSGDFATLEFTDPTLDNLVHLEHVNQITIRDDTELIARYLDRFARLEALALSSDDSIDFLDELISDTSSAPITAAAKNIA